MQVSAFRVSGLCRVIHPVCACLGPRVAHWRTGVRKPSVALAERGLEEDDENDFTWVEMAAVEGFLTIEQVEEINACQGIPFTWARRRRRRPSGGPKALDKSRAALIRRTDVRKRRTGRHDRRRARR